MRKLLILSALAILTTATSGCNCMRGSGGCCWRGGGGGLFDGGTPAYAAAPAYGQAAGCCCPQVCCDPCAGTGVSAGVVSGYGSEGCCQ